MLRVHRRQATPAPRFTDASLAPLAPESIKAIAALLRYLPMQKLEKIRPSNASLVTRPVISPSAS